MVSFAKKINDSTEQLQSVSVEWLYNLIKNSNDGIKSQLRQLRIMRNVDETKYRNQKKMLPYFVCAHFSPSFRKTENFAYTEYFVVDVDHLAQKGLTANEVKNKLKADDRVLMCFVSPSEDGLKVLIKLSERCYDAGWYSLFYKNFLWEFSHTHNLNQVIDTKTCDVTRACFLSYDPEVYYNPNATSVNASAYVADDNPLELYEEKKKLDAMAVEGSRNNEDGHPIDPDVETMAKIRQTLNPNAKIEKKQFVYIPEILNQVISEISEYITSKGITVDTIRNISYGKQIHCTMGLKKAEVNLFYGSKKGFSVVETTKSGTNKELTSLVAEIIENCLVENYGNY